jgi:hypothetical protein
MRKLLRELKREFPFATIETTGGNHYRIILPNGRVVIVANTPSCRNYLRSTRADVRRQSKQTPSQPFSKKSESTP